MTTLSNQDFIAIKLGDVNNSWDPNIPKDERFAGKIYLNMDCAESIYAGETITIPVRARQFENVSGLQFTLSWDKAALEIHGVENGKLQADFTAQRSNEGMLGVLWTDENAEGNTLDEDEVLFTLKCVSNKTGACEMNITSQMIPVEAVNGNLELLQLTEWKEGNGNAAAAGHDFLEGYRVYPNQPNPFSEYTTLKFELPVNDRVTIAIFDLLGGKVYEQAGIYEAGLHEIQTGHGLARGVYHLRLSSKEFSRSMKILRF